MFKVVYVARLRPDQPAETVRAYWTDTHGELGKAVPGLRSYVQNHVVGAIGPQGVSDAPVMFDGYSIHVYDDRAAFDAAMATEAWQDILDDAANVFDVESMESGWSAVLEERVIRDGPTSPFKVVWIARFRPDVDFQVAADHWLNVHGPIALGAPGVDRYVQNLAVASIGTEGGTDEQPAFAGFSECWFADRDAYVRSQESEAWGELYEDGFNFLVMDALEGMSAVLDERVIV